MEDTATDGIQEEKNKSKTPDTKCKFCGSTNVTTDYTLDRDAQDEIPLCTEHGRLLNILGRQNSPTPAQSIDTDAQRTQKVTIRIPQSLVEAADASGETQGKTRSELVRDAIQIYVELDDIDNALEDLISQAIDDSTNHERENTKDTDTVFLKNRIRRLESLLENSINKI